MTSGLPKTSVAEALAEKIVALKPGALSAVTTRKCEDLLIDVVGLALPRATRTMSGAPSRAATMTVPVRRSVTPAR